MAGYLYSGTDYFGYTVDGIAGSHRPVDCNQWLVGSNWIDSGILDCTVDAVGHFDYNHLGGWCRMVANSFVGIASAIPVARQVDTAVGNDCTSYHATVDFATESLAWNVDWDCTFAREVQEQD